MASGNQKIRQQSLSDFVQDLENAGMLIRIKDEKRVDRTGNIRYETFTH